MYSNICLFRCDGSSCPARHWWNLHGGPKFVSHLELLSRHSVPYEHAVERAEDYPALFLEYRTRTRLVSFSDLSHTKRVACPLSGRGREMERFGKHNFLFWLNLHTHTFSLAEAPRCRRCSGNFVATIPWSDIWWHERETRKKLWWVTACAYMRGHPYGVFTCAGVCISLCASQCVCRAIHAYANQTRNTKSSPHHSINDIQHVFMYTATRTHSWCSWQL